MSDKETFRIVALVLLLTVVGLAGDIESHQVMAQERFAGAVATTTVHEVMPGNDVLVAVGTLQLLGVIVFEAWAYSRRRMPRRLPPTVIVGPWTVPGHARVARRPMPGRADIARRAA
jgi:hypothetical protein